MSWCDNVTPQIITWLIVIIGWLIINNQQNQRETRKEKRALMDGIIRNISIIENAAIEYHTSARDLKVERKIKVQIQRVAKSSSILGLKIDNNDLPKKISRFRKSITYDNFDTPNHAPIEITDDLIGSISASRDELVYLLERAFSRKYK